MSDNGVLSEAEAVAQRAKLRAAMKQEFQKKISHPYRHGEGGGYMFDPAVQRFMAMKSANLEHFKVTAKTGKFGFFSIIVPLVGICYYFKVEREEAEHKLRTGQVAYRDRPFKFS